MITISPYVRITTAGPHIAAYVGNWVERAIAVGQYSLAGLVAAINSALSGTGGQVQAVNSRQVKNSGNVDLILCEGMESEKLARALGWYDLGGGYSYRALPSGTPVSAGETPSEVSFLVVPLASHCGLVYDAASLDGVKFGSGIIAVSDAGLVAAIGTAQRYDLELTLTGLPSSAVGGYDEGAVYPAAPQVIYALSPAWRDTAEFALTAGGTTRNYALREWLTKDNLEPMGELRQYWRLRLPVCRR